MNLLPIETAPKDGTWILLFGPSGYTTTPLRCEICRWNPEYKPLDRWENHSNDAFADGGDDPTHWCPIPSVPQDVVLPEKTIAKKGGCYYCPECGHKFWEWKTESGEFLPAGSPCRYCVADTVR